MTLHLVDIVTIILFVALMIIIGQICKNKSSNISDYIRMGNKSTWWITGFSIFMQGFSAATFTGICGQAFIAGWSIVFVFAGNAAGFLLQALYIAPLMRRTRAITPGDALRIRFGPQVEQIYIWIGTIVSLVWGGFILLGFATFATTILGVPITLAILSIGLVVMFYSVTGGSWSVQITDSIQALILIPVTAAIAWLSLMEVGGIANLFAEIDTKGLAHDFKLLKSNGHEYQSALSIGKDLYTPYWLVAFFTLSATQAVTLTGCYRYLSLKDDKSATKSALLACVLMLLGAILWVVPPIVARLRFEDKILAIEGISNAADAAYAVIAMELLPPGLLGLVIVAMLAATMSSMDSFLTGTAGSISNNLIPPIRRLFKLEKREEKKALSQTRYINFFLGIWCISLALTLNAVGSKDGIFGIMINIAILIGAPSSLPIALAIFVKRLPPWGLYIGTGCGFLTSAIFMTIERSGASVDWPTKTLILAFVCIATPLISCIRYSKCNVSVHERANAFFRLISTPVDFKNEVGESSDKALLRIIGSASLGIGLAMLSLLLWTTTQHHQFALLGISLSLGVSGCTMLAVSRIKSD